MYAVIDVGSNTVRMNIYAQEDGRLQLLLSKKAKVGLAHYVKNGVLEQQGIDKAAAVLEEFLRLTDNLKIKSIHIFATAALRNASNGREMAAQLATRLKQPVHMLPGELEAELDFVGATLYGEVKGGILLDIGGGSTELVLHEEGEIKAVASLPVGSLNCYERYVSRLLPTRQERKMIKETVLFELKKCKEFKDVTCAKISALGGTVRAANKLNHNFFFLPEEMQEIKVPNLKKIIKMLEQEEKSDISLTALDTLLNIVPERVRTVLPGMIILQTLCKYFGCERLDVVKHGVRDGYLQRYVLEGKQPEDEMLLNPSEQADVVEVPEQLQLTEELPDEDGDKVNVATEAEVEAEPAEAAEKTEAADCCLQENNVAEAVKAEADEHEQSGE